MADESLLETEPVPSGGLVVIVDRAVCIGAAQCVLAAPELFEQDDEGLVVLLDETPSVRLEVSARDAAWRCPSGAVSVAEQSVG
jgi:ferredoxin